MTLQPGPHLQMVRPLPPKTPGGCEECLARGTGWVHLRMCLTCGHVGCCDSSQGRHARRHAATSEHPIVESYEPGEDRRWCFLDEVMV
jgi:uncharacterized UBP type Zn finger protein